MSNKTLDDAIKDANNDRVRRYPLLDVSSNVKELREIATAAQDYVVELNPELYRPEPWELVVQIVMQSLRETFKFLNDRKSTDFGEVYIPYGTLMTISITYGETNEGDKNGTFNPAIKIGDDLSYENREMPYNDAMSGDMAEDLREIGMEYLHPMFYDQREQMKEIFEKAAANLAAQYGVKVPDPEALSYVVVAFFRKAKEYLIAHKDDNPVETSFYIGRLVNMGIEKDKKGDYFISIVPAPEFKMDNAKGDDKTEIDKSRES